MSNLESEGGPVYKGNFSLPEVAETWTIYQNIPLGRWEYFNHGGRDEDIFFSFDPEISSDETESDNYIRDAALISPPVKLKAGTKYQLSYEIRLFGTKFPAETRLMMWEANGNSVLPSENKAETLEHCIWPLDNFQWPVSSVKFSVKNTTAYRFALRICNAVAMRFYWLSIFEDNRNSQVSR